VDDRQIIQEQRTNPSRTSEPCSIFRRNKQRLSGKRGVGFQKKFQKKGRHNFERNPKRLKTEKAPSHASSEKKGEVCDVPQTWGPKDGGRMGGILRGEKREYHLKQATHTRAQADLFESKAKM